MKERPNHSRQPLRPSSALRKGERSWLGLAAFHRSTLKRDGMSPACHRRQQRQRSPEAFSVSVTSCATDATVSHHVPGGAASDHPRHPRDPRSLSGHRVISFLTKSNQALEPTETRVAVLGVAAPTSPVVSGLGGSVPRFATRLLAACRCCGAGVAFSRARSRTDSGDVNGGASAGLGAALGCCVPRRCRRRFAGLACGGAGGSEGAGGTG